MKKIQKGSISVFIAIILMSMFSAVIIFNEQCKSIAEKSYIDSVLRTANRSLLSEFNIELKNKYGIMAFSGFPVEISSKSNKYIEYSFSAKKNITLNNTKFYIDEYVLDNTKVFENEVIGYSKIAFAKNLFNKYRESENQYQNISNSMIESNRDYILKNEKIIESLPSKNSNVKNDISEQIKNGEYKSENIFKEGTNSFFVNQYILNCFNSKVVVNNKEAFFNNEVEYIICGKLSDQKNEQSIRIDLLLLRNTLNLAYICSNKKMMSEVVALATAISPGPQSLILQAAIIEAWALAEAENDVRILESGEKVPLVKSKTTWALDFDNFMKNKKVVDEKKIVETNNSTQGKNKRYVPINSENGLTYLGYMQVFLFLMDKETKLLRMMDLIQINIQGNYDSTFLMNNANTGFSVKYRVNNRSYIYDETY